MESLDNIKYEDWGRSGKETHKYLMQKSYSYLSKLGYNVKIEHRLENNKIADVIGFKDKEKIIIECLVRPNLKIVKKKISNYKDHCDKLIITYPSKFIPKFPIKELVEVIEIDLPLYMDKEITSIRVSKQTRDDLMLFKIQCKAKDLDQTINLALDKLKEIKNLEEPHE